MDKICITFDIDWVSDELVKYVVNLLEQYQIKATFFATHESALLKSLDSAKYEIGIHPNFNKGDDYNKIIEDLKVIYPKAIGVRSHSLFESSHILRLFLDNGLKYDTNTFIPLRKELYPFIRLNKLVRIPYYWEDDAHFSRPKITFKLSELQLHKRGLKIYNFHPIHIFMNTDSLEHYNKYMSFYHQSDILINFRNHGGEGISTLFLELLEFLDQNMLPTYTCKEIYHEYLTKEKNL
ncbi:hypothetical protein DK28_0215645 [Peptococcaceae bacterium SCADC1_2_3]|jgi:hypothetical protein|nr:hypothetical protein DK28_0215645 [Peptococcaceae bacterium SCADC1_2_3]KFI34745.1 hypothetical protein HY00_09960 [Peptococcaceae bacterium SCADC1_2_3]